MLHPDIFQSQKMSKTSHVGERFLQIVEKMSKEYQTAKKFQKKY